MNFGILPKELEHAAKRISIGKACGLDKVCNEMVLCLVNTYPTVVIKLFNDILKSNEVISDWVIGMIVPIYKDGQKIDPNNYRGITIISCLGKLFLSILNARLSHFVKQRNILSDCHLGFVEGNRTSDAHIIIHNLIRNTCYKNNSKIYSCFVDFKKAFDLIPRDLLLDKLQNLGIKGKFFNIIRFIYTTDKAWVKVGKVISHFG